MLLLTRKRGDAIEVGPLLLTFVQASRKSALLRVTRAGRWLVDLSLRLGSPPRDLPLPGCTVCWVRHHCQGAIGIEAPREIPIVRTDARLTVPR